MKYAYEDLSPEQFEKLVVGLCQELLGLTTRPFANGPDGGRDGKFTGTAQLIPSKTAPWKGTVIIQAKHTIGHNHSFSDPDFFGVDNENTVLGEELSRVRSLRQSGELDHYMLFSNRRLTGNAESKITDHISAQIGIPAVSICLCGIELIETWMKRFPDVPRRAGIDPVDGPLTVSPDELAEVIEVLVEQLPAVTNVVQRKSLDRVRYDDKNRINNMSAEYAKTQVRNYLKQTQPIESFFNAPENAQLLERYQTAAEEFQLKIMAKRKDYQTFDEVMEYLADVLWKRDPMLSRNKRLTRAVLFFMYWSCDIGVNDDAQADQA